MKISRSALFNPRHLIHSKSITKTKLTYGQCTLFGTMSYFLNNYSDSWHELHCDDKFETLKSHPLVSLTKERLQLICN